MTISSVLVALKDPIIKSRLSNEDPNGFHDNEYFILKIKQASPVKIVKLFGHEPNILFESIRFFDQAIDILTNKLYNSVFRILEIRQTFGEIITAGQMN